MKINFYNLWGTFFKYDFHDMSFLTFDINYVEKYYFDLNICLLGFGIVISINL